MELKSEVGRSFGGRAMTPKFVRCAGKSYSVQMGSEREFMVRQYDHKSSHLSGVNVGNVPSLAEALDFIQAHARGRFLLIREEPVSRMDRGLNDQAVRSS